MTRARIAFGWTAFAVLLLLGPADCVRGGDIYISPRGDDTAPGTKDRPFATLDAARNAVRVMKAGGNVPAGGITVWLAGGDYVLARSFELGAQDGGTSESPITYRAIQNERVRLLGGRAIDGLAPVTDEAILSRLDAQARGHVMSVDLRAAGVADMGVLRSRGFGRPTTPAHLELFFAGKPMTLARWPDEGQWQEIAGIPEDSGQDDGHGGKIGDLKAGFHYAGDRPRRWKSQRDVWVHGYWSWDWANSYEQVEAIDLERRLIKTAAPHGLYGFRKGQRFYFLNVLEELDQPGEYYVDRETARLYFWPPTRQAGSEVLVSVTDSPLISLDGVSHVTLCGLSIEAGRGHGVSIRGGENNIIAGCTIRLMGNYGVWIDGGRGHEVVSCDVAYTGDGGVSISGGDRKTLEKGAHAVLNCHFQHQGRWSKCYVPAVLASGVGHRIANSLIHDHPHCAILFTGNDHVIEFNEIHHIALETGDVGAIYTGRDWTYRGNVIRHNFIHHTGGVGMGSMGVYMDDCVSGTEISGNVFYQVSRAAFLGGGRDHKVVNNVFVDCRPAVQMDGRGMDSSPVWHNMVSDFMKGRLAAVPADLYRSRYPAINDLDKFYAADSRFPPENNVVAKNICVGGQWLSVGWHATEKMLQLGENYLGEMSDFVAPDKMDFRLKEGSAGWKCGFEAIPADRIGLREDPYRRRSPDGYVGFP